MAKMNVCIKNVGENDWRELRIEAIKHKTPIGRFIGRLVREHKMLHKKKIGNAKSILFGEKTLKGILNYEDLKKVREELNANLGRISN